MRRWVAGVTALALLLGGVRVAWAGGHYGGGCAPGCGVTYQYQTTYQQVQRTVYRWVPVTTEQEVTETVLVPVTREETRTQTVYVPTTRNETRQYTAYQCQYQTQQRQQTVMVPVTKEVEQQYTVC